MNAIALTIDGFKRVILREPRISQTVHVCSTLYSDSVLGPRHMVLVIQPDEEVGSYFICRDRTLALLKTGMTPMDLELTPLTRDEVEQYENGEEW